MIKITMQPTISIDDICEEMNLHMSDFEFVQMAENGSYVSLDLSDGALEELWENIEWEAGKDTRRYNRLKNEEALVKRLRDMGYRGGMLVYVDW